jgi:nucleoside phosphorylase
VEPDLRLDCAPWDAVLAVVAALPWEVGGLLRRLDAPSVLPIAHGRLVQGSFNGKPLYLLTTGVGPFRAQEAAEAFFDSYNVDAVVIAGVAGGVTPELRPGAVVVSSSVTLWEPEGDSFTPGEALSTDSHLVQTARETLTELNKSFITGRTASCPELLSSRRWKEELFRRSGAQVVDMESFWIARAVRVKGVPWANIRAVLDTAKDSLPRYLLGFGEGARVATAGRLLLHPWDWPKALALAKKDRVARKSLEQFLSSYLRRF